MRPSLFHLGMVLPLLGLGCKTPVPEPVPREVPSKPVSLALHATALDRALALLEEHGGVRAPSIPASLEGRRLELRVENVPASEVLSAIGAIYPELGLPGGVSPARPVPGSPCAKRLGEDRDAIRIYATFRNAAITPSLAVTLDWVQLGYLHDCETVSGRTVTLEAKGLLAREVLDEIAKQHPELEFRFTERLVIVTKRVPRPKGRKPGAGDATR